MDRSETVDVEINHDPDELLDELIEAVAAAVAINRETAAKVEYILGVLADHGVTGPAIVDTILEGYPEDEANEMLEFILGPMVSEGEEEEVTPEHLPQVEIQVEPSSTHTAHSSPPRPESPVSETISLSPTAPDQNVPEHPDEAEGN